MTNNSIRNLTNVLGVISIVLLIQIFAWSHFLKIDSLVTLVVFFGSSAIALWWYDKNYQQKEREMQGALNISVDCRDRIYLKNQGNVVMKITEIHMKTDYSKEKPINPKSLIEKYNQIEKEIQASVAESKLYELPYQKATNLAASENIILIKDEYNVINEPIQNFKSAVRVLCIKYEVSHTNKFTRYIGMYNFPRHEEIEKGLIFDGWHIFISKQDDY